MMRISEANGRRVMARTTAHQIGAVKRYLIDPGQASIRALHVGDRAGKPLLVEWRDIVGFGADAVVVAGDDVLHEPGNEREERFARGDQDLNGKLILSERGEALGKFKDAEFDEQSGRIIRLVLDKGTLDVERLVAIGPYAIIVPA